jgi:gamma-glutamyltranspeptidase
MTEAKKSPADRAATRRPSSQRRCGPATLEGLREQRAASIDMQHAALTDTPGEFAALNRKETTYFCTADDNGMMVSTIRATTRAERIRGADVGFALGSRRSVLARPAQSNALAPEAAVPRSFRRS